MNALLVIDMQQAYVGSRSKNTWYSPELLDRVNERIIAAAGHGDTVVYVKNAGRRNKAPYVSALADGLAVVSEHIVEKDRSSVFSNPAPLTLLKEKAVRTIECIGVDGNCCVASSAIEASRFGFSVIFPLDYIGIKSMERFRRTREKLLKARVRLVEHNAARSG